MASSKFVRMYPIKEQFISNEDLEETERLLNNLKCSQSRAASCCKSWAEQREKSIETIDCLEKRLENLHRACNAAHCVGSAMEVVGGLAMVAGAIFTACGHKDVGEFLTKKVSTVSTVTGVATTMSSSVAEIGLTQKTMKDVKMVLEKDMEYTREFMENFEHSQKIDSYLSRIFNCSVLSNIFLDVVRLCKEGIVLLEVGSMEVSKLYAELKRKARKCSDVTELTETVIQNVYTTMKNISSDRKVRKAVWNICDIIQQSPSSIEFIKLGLRTSIQICDILKVDIFANLIGLSVLKTSAGEVATKCLLGTVLVAANVLSVISSAQEAQEGTSKYSKMLTELKLALTLELNAVRKNYSKLL